jgi:hypothetical protein
MSVAISNCDVLFNLSYYFLVAYLQYWHHPLLQTFLQPLRWGEICIRIYKQTKYDSKQHKQSVPLQYIYIPILYHHHPI